MISVGAFEARTRFAELLDKVEAGEQVVITRHQVPVARLVSAAAPDRPSVTEAIRALREFRKGRPLSRSDLRSMIEDGRA